MALVTEYVRLLVGFVLCLLLIVFHHRRRNRNTAITSWPVVGMLPGLLHNVPRFHDFMAEVVTKSGGTFEFIGPCFGADMDFIITSDPLNVQHILNKNFANYPKGPELKEILEPLGDGILNADSELWRLQRKMFQLWNGRQSKFDVISRTIQQKVADALIPFLDHVSETGIQVDIQEAFKWIISLDNALLLVFGFDLTSNSIKFPDVAEYRKAFRCVPEEMFLRNVVPVSFWRLQRWLQVGGGGRLRRASKMVDEFMYRCISQKREELRRRSESKKDQYEDSNADMMTVYLKDEKENLYSDKFLKDVALNLVSAALDTLTVAFAWFLWLVATHPSVETKLVEEMKENLPMKDGNYCGLLGVDDLNKLVYLQATIYESLRLYPPVPFNHKTAAEEDVLPSGHRVKRKKRVLINFYAMGRMEEIWGKDCLEFKPERWISERGGFVYVPSHKFAAFNTGPRTCLGKEMALIQLKVVAIAVLRGYRLQVVEGHPISPQLAIAAHIKQGLKVQVSKRCA